MVIKDIEQYVHKLTELVDDFIKENKIETLENGRGINYFKNKLFANPKKIPKEIRKILNITGVQRATLFQENIKEIATTYTNILSDNAVSPNPEVIDEVKTQFENDIITQVLQLLRRDKKGPYNTDGTVSTKLAFAVGSLTYEHLGTTYPNVYEDAEKIFTICDEGANKQNLIVTISETISRATGIYLSSKKDPMDIEMGYKKILPGTVIYKKEEKEEIKTEEEISLTFRPARQIK